MFCKYLLLVLGLSFHFFKQLFFKFIYLCNLYTPCGLELNPKIKCLIVLLTESDWHLLFTFLKKISFIYSWETQRGRDIGRGRSRLPTSSPMWDSIPGPGITPWAKGRCSTAEPPRHPSTSSFLCVKCFLYLSCPFILWFHFKWPFHRPPLT